MRHILSIASREGCGSSVRAGLSVAFLTFLVGCGEAPQAGGGGIEIPNGLTLTVNSADNKPVKNVAVRLLARESWTRRTVEGADVVLDTAFTDSLGKVSFALPAGEGYWVEASTHGMGLRVQGDGPESKTAVLASLSKISGYLGAGPVAGVRVRLAGTSRTTLTDAQGRFVFDSIPQSGYSMVGQTGASRKLTQLGDVDLGLAPAVAQGLDNDTTAVVLDNFADGDNIWLLHGLFGSGYWWIAANNPDLTKVFGIQGAFQAVTTDGIRRWMAVTVDATAMASPWAGLGIDFGAKGAVLPEWSAAQDLRLNLRGKGGWSVAVVVDEVDGESVHWTSSVMTLDTAWSTIRVPFASLVSDRGPAEVWSAKPRKVRQFLLQTAEAGRLDLGELAVDGATLGDWAK
ncbi:MAG: hypothetical protein RL173_1784 [Fibrobacterota bacterium]